MSSRPRTFIPLLYGYILTANRRAHWQLSVLTFASIVLAGVSCAYAADAPATVSIYPGTALSSTGNKIAHYVLVDGEANQKSLALICSLSVCALQPVTDVTTDMTEDTPDENKPSRPSPRVVALGPGEFAIAVLEGIPNPTPRVVPTWFTARTPRVPADEANGSLGVTIRREQNTDYHLMPRWNAQTKRLLVFLEAPGQRQQLSTIDLDTINAGINTKDLLVWAGDLDGDSKIDLITGVGADASLRGAHLWLSSRAVQGEMVGDVAFAATELASDD